MNIRLSYNSSSRALQVMFEGTKIAYSCEDAQDSLLIFSYDERREMVGLLILRADDLSQEEWSTHPGRDQMPEELIRAVAEWLRTRKSANLFQRRRLWA